MSSSSLEVHRRPKPEKRSKLWRFVVIGAAVVLVVGWLIWYLRTPDDLPLSDRTVSDSGVVGQELYVGMFAVGDEFDRTLRISEITVDVDSDGETIVEPKICRDGSLSVTTDASGFCSALDDPTDADFSAGDSIVLVVTASEPTEVSIGRLEISFREGIRWGTKGAGYEGAVLSFAEGAPADVDEDTTSDDTTTERPEGTKDDKKGERKKVRRDGNA